MLFSFSALREHVEQLSPGTKNCLEELLMTLSLGEGKYTMLRTPSKTEYLGNNFPPKALIK